MTAAKPEPSSEAQSLSVQWQNVSPQKWYDHLHQLLSAEISPKDRLYWMSALQQWTQCNIQLSADGPICFKDSRWPQQALEPIIVAMAEVAYRLCDWPSIGYFHQLLDNCQRTDPQVEVECLQRAVALWQMGQFEQAKQGLEPYLKQVEPQSPVHHFYAQLERDSLNCQFSESELTDGDIHLTPLEDQHLASFCWVYHDPQIAALCNLPDFAGDEQWFDWLSVEQSNPAKWLFAVCHRRYGMIGSVSIEVREGAGYIYYWLGQDFQGGGYGPKAVLLMLSLAERYLNLQSCYAKVFDYNLPSQKALSKMGFRPLPFKLAKPNQSQLYFYRGQERPLKAIQSELSRLMRYTDVGNELLAQD